MAGGLLLAAVDKTREDDSKEVWRPVGALGARICSKNSFMKKTKNGDGSTIRWEKKGVCEPVASRL